jgi:hypothetical protein
MGDSTGTQANGADKIKELESRVKVLEDVKTHLEGAAWLGRGIWAVVGGAVVALLLSCSGIGGIIWNYAVLTTEMGHQKLAVKELETRQEKATDKLEARLTDRIAALEKKPIYGANMQPHDGKIISVKGRSITINENDKELTYILSKEGTVSIDGKEAKLEDIRAGGAAAFFTLPGEREVTRIEITTKKE